MGSAGFTVFHKASSRGFLIVDQDSARVEVEIQHRGHPSFKRTSRQEVSLRPGLYELRLTDTKHGRRLSATSVSIPRGGRKAVQVVTAAELPDPNTPPGFTPLFNGTDLRHWQVVHGSLDAWDVAEPQVLYTTGQGGGWLMTEKEYGDFELQLEYKVSAGANSGVALRSPLDGDPAYAGMEIQILDDAAHPDLLLTEYTCAIYDVVPPSAGSARPAGQWNNLRIIAQGRRIAVRLNDLAILDADLEAFAERAEKHPGLSRKSGHLGLQCHDGRVEFRRVYLKPL
jgi:hypothetical protein